MKSLSGMWCHSSNEEVFNTEPWETKDEAIRDALAYGYEGYAYVGRIDDTETRFPEGGVDADTILDQMESYLHDLCGEVSEDSLHCSKEQQDELTDAVRATIAAWLDKHNLRPTCYRVVDREWIEIPQENDDAPRR